MHFFCDEENAEAVFWRVFGNPIFKQAILFHCQLQPLEPLILDVPQSVQSRIKEFVRHDSDLSPLPIRFEKKEREEVLPLNRVFHNKKDFMEVCSKQDLFQLRQLMKKEILKNCPTLIARTVNKRLSLPFSHVLAFLNIRPNTISFTALFFSFLGAFFLLQGKIFLGFLFFQINSILDGCDGEVAQFNLKATRFGKKLDVYGDYITSILLMGSASVILLQILSPSWFRSLIWFSLLLLALLGLIWLFVLVFRDRRREFDDIEGICHRRLSNPKTFLEKILVPLLWISRRDFYIFVLFCLSLFPVYGTISLFIFLVALSWFSLSIYSLWLLRSNS